MKYLSTKIHNNVTILKLLQKSQHCLLQKQIISRYRPNLIENLAISNVNIFGIFAKMSQKLCNRVLINRIHNQNWNINWLTNSKLWRKFTQFETWVSNQHQKHKSLHKSGLNIIRNTLNEGRFSIFPQKNPIFPSIVFRGKIAKSQTPKYVASSTMWFSQRHLW